MTGQGALTRPSPTMAPGVREIGSEFEVVDDRYLGPTTSTPLPWEDPAGTIYVESGRQALALVEAELRRQGNSQLHAPSYLCDSMIGPFHGTGWTLTGLPVDRDLAVPPTDLLSQVTGGVLLHAPYFGRQDSPATLAALETLRGRGVVVIVDETHRLLSGPSEVADIRVASLRKLLPVYDGGYVIGLPGRCQIDVATSSTASQIAALCQRAQISKSIALASGDGNTDHLALFARAKHALEIQTHPAPISSRSFALLHRLDLNLIRKTRQTNSTLLAEALGQGEHYRVINGPASNLLPSHLVLETDEVSRLHQYLTAHRIYCPIHWPPAELLTRTEGWPTCYLSLPIDHRYEDPDILRIAAHIHSFFRDVSP